MENMTLEQKIIHLYHDKKMSVRQVVKTLRCGHNTVRETLHEKNLMRDRKTACQNRTSEEYIEKVAAAKRGTKNSFAKLDDEKVLSIRASYPNLLNTVSPTIAQRMLADDYKVSRSTILDIVHERTWKHLL